MFSDPDCSLSESMVICVIVCRPDSEGKVDLYDISWELVYRARMVNRFSQPTVASAGDGSVDSGRRKLNLQVTPQTKCPHTGVMRNCPLLYSCHSP